MGDREILRDVHNRIEGYIQYRSDGTTVITDQHGKILGFIEHGQTKDAHRRLVAKSEQPGLLFRGA